MIAIPFDQPKLPPNLEKATFDDWTYAVGLITGEVFVCESIEVEGDWLHLKGGDCCTVQPMRGIESTDQFCFGRGLDVRLSCVSWIGDCES